MVVLQDLGIITFAHVYHSDILKSLGFIDAIFAFDALLDEESLLKKLECFVRVTLV